MQAIGGAGHANFKLIFFLFSEGCMKFGPWDGMVFLSPLFSIIKRARRERLARSPDILLILLYLTLRKHYKKLGG